MVCRKFEAGVSAFAAVLLAVGGQALAQSQILVADTSGKVVRFDAATGLALDHFVGVGISQLQDARDMVIGPDQKLYVASRNNSSIYRYDSRDGYFSDTFVGPGFGGLGWPHGMVFGSDGMLYVASNFNHRILRFNPSTGVAEQFVPRPNGGASGGLNGPTGLAFGPDGHLYVASHNNSSVLRFDGQTGDFIDEVMTPSQLAISGPMGLLFDADGNLFVASYGTNSVIRLAAGSSTPAVFVSAGLGGLSNPYHMAFYPSADAPDRRLLVVSIGGAGRVLRYNATTGQYLGVAVDSNAGGLNNDPISVLVLPDPVECRADFNNDGVIDANDFFAFLSAFAAGCD